jgi:hypothetical protein
MIDIKEAERLARDTIRNIAGTAENEFSLQSDRTVTHEAGWIFFYNSLRYIETGDPNHMLAGNGPVFVSKDGSVTVIPSHTPWQEFINRTFSGSH